MSFTTWLIRRNNPQSHESFIHTVKRLACGHLTGHIHRTDGVDCNEINQILSTKLVYGIGKGRRGSCHYSAWKNGQPEASAFIEISAAGEESALQLAGTTVHELGHALAGHGAGHGKDWKSACERLGLTRALAAGQTYDLADFAPELRERINRITEPNDGRPVFGSGRVITRKGCTQGIGTRGGKSQGKGSGSRLRLWTCSCTPPVKVRVSSDDFKAHCDVCKGAFKR